MLVPFATPPAIEITYVGGPTAVVEVGGLRLLLDPTFDGPGRYTAGPVVLEKTEGPALQPEDLGRIDAILLSHDQHPDNLDRAGRVLTGRLPTLTTRAGARRLGGTAIGLAPWEAHELRTADGRRYRVTATPARHGPVGIEAVVGDVIGFVVSSLEPARDLFYATGDTVWYEGTAEVARRFEPAAVLLFAGAARTRGPFRLTLDTNEAVELAAAFRDAVLVPVHHAGWKHFTQSQGDLIQTFDYLGLRERLCPVTPARRIALPCSARP